MKKNTIVIGVMLIGVLVAGYIYTQGQKSSPVMASYFSTDTRNLKEAKQSDVVTLENGAIFDLTAQIVKKKIGDAEVKMLAYNGMVPGPMIKVTQGAEITLNFKNETDVPSTIHSHGLRLDNANDGVPDVTQKEVLPGELFTYKLKFPDAGVYWYHPHVREDYAQELGLYGNYLVTPTNENYWNPVNRELALFLDDILIENGAIVPFDKKQARRTLMGRFGNVMLVNGDDSYTLNAKQGEVVRLYLTNAASTRIFNFTIPGVKIKRVGGDNGAYERDEWQDAVRIAPSERVVVEALFDTSGMFVMQNKAPEKTTQLGTVIVSTDVATPSFVDSFRVLKTHEEVVASIDSFRKYFDMEPTKRLKLSIDLMGDMGKAMGGGSMSGMGGGGHMMPDGTMMGGDGSSMMMQTSPDGIEWEDSSQMMNSVSTAENVKWKIVDEATQKENMNIDWSFKVGDKVKIRITNDGKSMHPMQHPIHFHGQRFLILNENGVPNNNLVWKDTVLVPSGRYVDILLDVSNPGQWMGHCHIAEHLESGMMFSFKVK